MREKIVMQIAICTVLMLLGINIVNPHENVAGQQVAQETQTQTTSGSAEPITWSVPTTIATNATLKPILKWDSNLLHLVWVVNNTIIYTNSTTRGSSWNTPKCVVSRELNIIDFDYAVQGDVHLIAYTLANYSTYMTFTDDGWTQVSDEYVGRGITPSVLLHATKTTATKDYEMQIGYQGIVNQTIRMNLADFTHNRTVFDGSSIKLATHTDILPLKLAYADTVLVGNTLYVIGGTEDGVHGTDTIFAFDLNTYKITDAIKMPYGVFGHAAVAYNNSIYIIGGCTEDGNYTKKIMRYVPQERYVSVLDIELPVGTAFGFALLHPRSVNPFDAIWIMPGKCENNTCRDELWRLRLDTWSIEVRARTDELAELPHAYYGMKAVRDGDCLFIFGGRSGEQFVDRIYKLWMYDGWRYIDSIALPYGVADMGIAMLGHVTYLFGGRTANGYTDDIIECFHEPWSYPWEGPRIVAKLAEPMAGICAVPTDSTAYLLGGQTASEYKNEITEFKPITYTLGTALYSTTFDNTSGWYLNATDGNTVQVSRGKLYINSRADIAGYAYALSPYIETQYAAFRISLDFRFVGYDNQMFWLIKDGGVGIGVQRNSSQSGEYGSMTFVDEAGHYVFITYAWPDIDYHLEVIVIPGWAVYVFLNGEYCGAYRTNHLFTGSRYYLGDIGEVPDSRGACYFDNFAVHTVNVQQNVVQKLAPYYADGFAQYELCLESYPISLTPYWDTTATGTVSVVLNADNSHATLTRWTPYNFTSKLKHVNITVRLSTDNCRQTPELRTMGTIVMQFDTLNIMKKYASAMYVNKRWVWIIIYTNTTITDGTGKLLGRIKFTGSGTYLFATNMENDTTWMYLNNTTGLYHMFTVIGEPQYGFDVATYGKQQWIVWSDMRTGTYQIYMRYTRDGGLTWREQRLTFGTGYAKHPQISLDNSKDVHITYLENSEYIWNIGYVKYSSYGRRVERTEILTDFSDTQISGYYADGTPYAGAVFASIITDVNGAPHVIYLKDNELKYTNKIGTVSENVESTKQDVFTLSDDVFSGNATLQKNTLGNKYDAVENMIAAQNTKGAVKKLKEDIIPKTSGEWIVEASASAEITDSNMEILASLEGPQVTITKIEYLDIDQAAVYYYINWGARTPKEVWAYLYSGNQLVKATKTPSTDSTSVVWDGLAQNVTYTTKIVATATDNTSGSASKSFMISLAITNICILKVSDNSVKFTWYTSLPTSQNTIRVWDTNYDKTYNEVNPDVKKTEHASPEITGLSTTTTYTYRITAGTVSNSSSFQVPVIQIFNVVVNASTDKAVINWSTNVLTDTCLTWKVYKPAQDDYGWCWYYSSTQTTTHTATIMNLNPGEQYEYYIIAHAKINNQNYMVQTDIMEFHTKHKIISAASEAYYDSTRHTNGIRVYWETTDSNLRDYVIELCTPVCTPYDTPKVIYSTTVRESGNTHFIEIPKSVLSPYFVINIPYKCIISTAGTLETEIEAETETEILDYDNDGLSNAEESCGWEVPIVKLFYNYWDMNVYTDIDSNAYLFYKYHVFSNPCDPDEDLDGWNDLEEKTHHTIPIKMRAWGGGGGGGKPPLICKVSENPVDQPYIPDGKDTDNDGAIDSQDGNPNFYSNTKFAVAIKDYLCSVPNGNAYLELTTPSSEVQINSVTLPTCTQPSSPWYGLKDLFEVTAPPSCKSIVLNLAMYVVRSGFTVQADIDEGYYSNYDGTLTLTYDIQTGMWTGEDRSDESNPLGYGHTMGDADPNYSPCGEVWFDIIQRDVDIKDNVGNVAGGGDTIPMFRELQLGTDPFKWDTDEDGLPDGWEIKYGLDPIDNTGDNGGGGDPDHDGASNYDEWNSGTNPVNSQNVPSPPAPIPWASYRVITCTSVNTFTTSIESTNNNDQLRIRVTNAQNDAMSDPIYGGLPNWLYSLNCGMDTIIYPTLGHPEIAVLESSKATVHISVPKRYAQTPTVVGVHAYRTGEDYTPSSFTWEYTGVSVEITAVFSNIPSGKMYNLNVLLDVGNELKNYYSEHSLYILEDSTYYAGSFSFVQITDTHVGKTFWGYGLVGAQRSADYHMARLWGIFSYLDGGEVTPPKFAIFTGDLIDDPWDERGMQLVRNIIKSVSFPVFCTPGNHDNFGPFYDKYITEDNDYYFEWGHYFRFISYDSGLGFHQLTGLSLWTQQRTIMDWIENSQNVGRKHIFIFSHGPNVGDPEYRHIFLGIDNDKGFVEYLYWNKNYVEAVFAGHTHRDMIAYDVSSGDIDNPSHIIPNPTEEHAFYYSDATYYIITGAST